MAQQFNDTRDAALAACLFVTGRAVPRAGIESEQVEQLISDELRPFTHTVRMTVFNAIVNGRVDRHCMLWANDPGCVNNNHHPLATCWEENGRFYYEA